MMYEHRDDIQPAAQGVDVDVVRRRLLWGLWAAVIVTVLAAIPGILLDRGGDTKVTSAQPFLPVTTSTSIPPPLAGVATPPQPGPSTTVAKGVVTPVQSVPRHAGPTTTTARAAPAKPCRNSYDAACGPFRWDPDPGPNQPLTVTVSPPSQLVKPGDEMNFHVVADDPDAKIDRDCVVSEFGDGQTGGSCPPPAACPPPYGPWTPPARVHDHYELDIKHKYATAQPNPYTASFRLQSHRFCNPDPYGGSGQGPAQVTVS